MHAAISDLPAVALARAEPQPATVLAVEGVEAKISGSRILRGVSFEVRERSVFCLMGRNGVGKTSTLRSIVGLLKPSTGRVTLEGEEVTRLSPEKRARLGIGYVPQGREIFPHLTVEENLRIGCVARGVKPNGQLDRVFALFPILKDFLARTRREGCSFCLRFEAARIASPIWSKMAQRYFPF